MKKANKENYWIIISSFNKLVFFLVLLLNVQGRYKKCTKQFLWLIFQIVFPVLGDNFIFVV